ncbi:hypothetical protein U737_10505 [Methylomonas sp. LW13]|uniref:hypothetical protein n=1 Tax=unclassified Methylomonas TaxID=2608980 RepID=UPI00051B86CB|nr:MULTISPECIES: hypothetical protein [unclassified Methylomonas]PKD39963.1 hypothetical protein CWO84_12825 [Methylomonas sp. Kb3]QBC27299.1 hypothetical protein U737_10505 [Methylomonas sp. LW13]
MASRNRARFAGDAIIQELKRFDELEHTADLIELCYMPTASIGKSPTFQAEGRIRRQCFGGGDLAADFIGIFLGLNKAIFAHPLEKVKISNI